MGAVPYRDQEAYDQLLEYIHYRSMAGGAQTARDPRWTYWMAVAIGQERRLDELEERLAALEDDGSK